MLDDQNYLYVRCIECELKGLDTITKVAKHKGAGDWAASDLLPEFLLIHGGCQESAVKFEWTNG